jgi:hypothetical protein
LISIGFSYRRASVRDNTLRHRAIVCPPRLCLRASLRAMVAEVCASCGVHPDDLEARRSRVWMVSAAFVMLSLPSIYNMMLQYASVNILRRR